MKTLTNISTDKKQWLLIAITIIILLRITSYFTLFPGSIGITRVVKIAMRFLMTGSSLFLLLMMMSKNRDVKFQYSNITGGVLYLTYRYSN